MFTSVINSVTGTMSIQTALLCTAVSLVLGIGLAAVYMLEGTYSKSFLITLALLPAMVQIVIMLVNGQLGTSVAVMGAFSLVRFRSIPGSSREISGVFIAMVIGLATGMGYLTYAVLIEIVICLCMLLLSKTSFGETKEKKKDLKITIPESLDYSHAFDDLFTDYTKKYSLERVKTTNLGSMFELQYSIEMKDTEQEKKFIDALRCRNGNLTIVCGKPQTIKTEL